MQDKNYKNITIRLNVGNLITDSIIDTGTSHNIISVRLWNLIRFDRGRARDIFPVTDINVLRNVSSAFRVQAYQVDQVPVYIPNFSGKIEFKLNFKIANIPDVVILGMDFLTKAEAVLDLKNDMIVIKGQIIHLTKI